MIRLLVISHSLDRRERAGLDTHRSYVYPERAPSPRCWHFGRLDPRERMVASKCEPARARQPRAPAPGAGSDRPGVRASARCADHGSARSHVAGAFLTAVPGGLRRDAVQLPHDPPDRARDGAAARRYERHRRVHDGRLYLTRLVQFALTEIVGETPSAYRSREHDAVTAMPACVAKVYTRPTRNAPSRNGEAAPEAAA